MTLRATFMLLALLPASALAQAPKPVPDTLVFTNGEQLTGALEKADAKGITFKSPVAGELTVKWVDIKGLRTDKKFAILTADQKLTRKNAEAVVPEGSVTVADKQITVATATGPVTIPTSKADRVIDAAGFDKAVNRQPSLLEGWGGTASAGVSLVRATQDSTTFNGAIDLTRSTPGVDFLPPRTRSNLDYNQSYGTVSQAGTPTVKTNIFHAGAERDQYFTPRVFAFGSASFDHNYSESLDLQQAYGGGLGITLLKNAVRTLDFKGDLHFERQSFLPSGTPLTVQPTLSLVGSTFSEKYLRYLAKGLVLNEFGSFSTAWYQTATGNATMLPEPNAYSAHVNASLGFPVFKGFGFNLGAVDDYLNNAPVGSKKNSVQYMTNLTYTIKPR